MRRWWLPSLDISSLLYLHVSNVFQGALLLGAGGLLGRPVVQSFLGLLKQWVRPFPIIGPLFTCLAWTSVVFTSAFLGLRLCVRFGLAYGWVFVHPRTGPMGFMLCFDPSLPQYHSQVKLKDAIFWIEISWCEPKKGQSRIILHDTTTRIWRK